MRRSKIVLLLVAVLAMVMVLSSCSFGALKFSKILDGEAYKDENPSYTSATKVDDLKDFNFIYASRNLALFTKVDAETGSTTYKVYNMTTGATVYTATDSEKVDISCAMLIAGIDDAAYFRVRTVTWDDEGDYTVAVSMRDATGAEFAAAARDIDADTQYDLIRFDGKCYRIDSEGKVDKDGAFDYSAFAGLPAIVAATDKYYYGIPDDQSALIVYDKTLKIVSYYSAPSYADLQNIVSIVLDGGNVLFQYTVREDIFSDDYDFLDNNGNKRTLHTVLIKANGKAKEIKCDYVIEWGDRVDDKAKSEYGIGGAVTAFAVVYPVENMRVNASDAAMRWASINKNGKIKLVETPTVVPMTEFGIVAADLWYVNTADNRVYFMDKKAGIVGEISNMDVENSAYIARDGKLYDFKLNMVLDYATEKLDLKGMFDHSVYFTNDDEEFILFANGTKTTMISKAEIQSGKKDLVRTSDSYFIIEERFENAPSQYKIYNDMGTLLLTLNANEVNGWNIETTNNGKMILRVYGTVDSVNVINYYLVG